MSQLLSENIYLQFYNKETFEAFRLREGQESVVYSILCWFLNV